MDRYTVKFGDPHEEGEPAFLVPLTRTSTVSTLLTEATRRAVKRLPRLAEPDINLIPHYGGEEGPILDGDDILGDMIPDPPNEIIFVSTHSTLPRDTAQEPSLLQTSNSLVGLDYKGLKIRVITPELAKRHDSTKTIPLLDGGTPVAPSMTLCELKDRIAQSLGYVVENLPTADEYRECNCAFTRQILNRGIWKKFDCATHTGDAVSDQDLSCCQFHSPSTQSLMSNLCAICSDTILNHRPRETTSLDQTRDGCHNIFLRTDTACQHTLHSQCLQLHKSWTCPSSCQTMKPDSNETNILGKPSFQFIVVYGKSKVESIPMESSSKSLLLATLQSKFGNDVDKVKLVKFHGGVYESEKDQYVILPMVSICSRHRHTDATNDEIEPNVSRQATTSRTYSVESSSIKDLDLHTSEGHIVMKNSNLTISQVNFNDCMINDVLDIYVVERLANSSIVMDAGKDGMFTLADHWKLPIVQSERGMATFLSSLRVFTELVNAKKMIESLQNHILHLIRVLTRFPPAIRTMFILIQGKLPGPAECAALAQAFFEVLKDIIPLEIIEGDEKRIMEGSRLLFGFLLAVAKAQHGPEDQPTPYIESFRTIDLLNVETRQPISIPVETSVGLVEEGYYEAHREGGILSWSNGEGPMELRPIDPQSRRLALICGGHESEVVVLDWGLLDKLLHGSSFHFAFDRHPAFSDMNSLGVYCEQTGLAVVLPSALPRSQAPALTLDRECLQAVFVGRQPCGDPGKDIIIFRPTKAREETVDVSIITGLIASTLKAREKEKCAVFDLCGEGPRKKERTPHEIIVFCIDCSSSMNDPCGFNDTDEDEHKVADDSIKYFDEWEDEAAYNYEDDQDKLKAEDEKISRGDFSEDDQERLNAEEVSGLTLSETKQRLLDGDSFDDMMAIMARSGEHCRFQAFLILKQLVLMYRRELAHLKEHARPFHTACERLQHESRISWLELTIEGVSNYKETLFKFMRLSARRSNNESRDSNWTWKSGEAIPNRPPPLQFAARDVSNLFRISPDFNCPIQREVFEDPVIASDGFTYERRSIERWLQIRGSSPSTGLELRDANLVHNGPLADKIKRWIAGEPFTERQSNVPKRRRRTSSSVEPHAEIHFVSPHGSFVRKLPLSLSVEDLYRVAFQGMKGRNFKFDLRHNGRILHACQESIRKRGLADISYVAIYLTQNYQSSIPDNNRKPSAKVESEELALIKVYRGFDIFLFAFWVPRDTKQSLASIVFRSWRYEAENHARLNCHDVQIWTNMKDLGDSHFKGVEWQHWEPLSSLLTPIHATETFEDEGLLEKAPTRDTESLIRSSGPDKKPLVLKLSLCQRRSRENAHKLEAKNKLSRLDISKQIFDSFINRILAYDFSVHIGLITFKSTADVSQGITHAVENFRKSLDSMSAAGDTALWDAIALADDQLITYGLKYPAATKRIICLSDGVDTKSTRRSHEVSLGILQRKVVVDSFCLGNGNNKELRTMSHISGGYKFCPKTIEQAMAVCEMEPVLSQLERPPIRRMPISPFNLRTSFENASVWATPEVVTQDVYPARKEHENSKDSFVKVSSLAQSSRRSITNPITASGARKNPYTRSARLLSELQIVAANPHPHYEVFVSERNMGFWKVIMQGPPGSAYADGVFLLYLHMEDDYPTFAPKGRFYTPIFHPNINRHGRICHSLLDRNWMVDTTNVLILNSIYGLLSVVEFSDPINTIVTLNYHWDQVAFQAEVQKHIQKHAAISRDTLRAMVLGTI